MGLGLGLGLGLRVRARVRVRVRAGLTLVYEGPVLEGGSRQSEATTAARSRQPLRAASARLVAQK